MNILVVYGNKVRVIDKESFKELVKHSEMPCIVRKAKDKDIYYFKGYEKDINLEVIKNG